MGQIRPKDTMLQAEVVGVQSRNGPTKGLQRLKTKGGIEDSTMIHFVTISSPASKWELRGLQFHFIKWLKMGPPKTFFLKFLMAILLREKD